MKSTLIKTIVIALFSSVMATGHAGEDQAFHEEIQNDIEAFRAFFKKRFPAVEFEDYANGVYALDAASREQWEQIEEFAPYELSVDRGQELFEQPFANGKGYADCFENGGIGIAHTYPRFDVERKEVITLNLAINECREANGEKPMKYKSGDIADLSAYMQYTSRGNMPDVKVPNQDAYEAYLDGKKFFYSKRGQLNFSCADCHMRIVGQNIRADIMGPALGHTTGWPVYRSKWQSMGTLHRRYDGCNKNIRALPLAAQGPEYRNLEYFQYIMNSGLALNGPAARK